MRVGAFDLSLTSPSRSLPTLRKAFSIERLIQFGCAENADKIQPIPLKVIASQYLSGELSPLIN